MSVFQADEPLDGLEYHIRTQPTNLGKMIAEAAHAAAPHTQAVIINSGGIRIDDKVKGPVTQYDVMRILPYGGAMVEIDIDGELLEKVLRVGIRDNVGRGGYLQTYGIKVVDTGFMIDGKRVVKGQTYTILTGGFLLSGRETGLGFFTEKADGIKAVRRPGKDDILRDIRLAVIKFMKER